MQYKELEDTKKLWNDSWPLIEFTPCEKQKYQVTFVTKNKNISLHFHTTNSRTVSNLKAHLVRN